MGERGLDAVDWEVTGCRAEIASGIWAHVYRDTWGPRWRWGLYRKSRGMPHESSGDRSLASGDADTVEAAMLAAWHANQ